MDEVVVSAASFLVIHLLGPCSARVQKVDWSRIVIVHMTRAACRDPHLMYRQQAEPHEPVARPARIACLVTCHIVHITREHSESHEHAHEHE
jgi:hypothetical protein